MFAPQSTLALIATRAMIRILDLSPLFIAFRPVTLRNLPLDKRQDMIRRIENHPISAIRMMLFAVKIFISLPFFNREEAARAIGYLQPEVEA